MTPGREAWLATAACVCVCVCPRQSAVVSKHSPREQDIVCVYYTAHDHLHCKSAALHNERQRDTPNE